MRLQGGFASGRHGSRRLSRSPAQSQGHDVGRHHQYCRTLMKSLWTKACWRKFAISDSKPFAGGRENAAQPCQFEPVEAPNTARCADVTLNAVPTSGWLYNLAAVLILYTSHCGLSIALLACTAGVRCCYRSPTSSGLIGLLRSGQSICQC